MKYCKENSDYEEPVEENEKDEIIKNRIRKLLVRYNISDQRALRLENNIKSIIENREEVNINDKKLYILYIIREVLQEYR
ncbi:MAG: hypothetical protein Q9M94_06290 [Candidatus Gracilibacteria bacterium]|nr:hypothetical protein [Candidatus Gracilibacteria bacterium]MDQ7023058.1 hypothetical protein [Candidatus Gracilibacteria bacterium]